MAAKTKPSRQSQWASQAAQAALLRYAPQREGIAQLQREAKENYEGSVTGAESTGRLTSAAIKQAEPQVSDIFNRAQAATTSTPNATQLASVLSALGPAAAGFKAAAATESAQGAQRLASERATAEGSLQEQDVAAQSAPSYARTLAGQQLLKTLSKLSEQQRSVEGEEGVAAATESSKLEDEAEGRAVTERGQNITAQSDKEGHELTRASQSQKAVEHQEDLADKRQARTESGAAGAKPLSLKENNAGAAAIQQIKQFAAEGGGSRAERVAALTEGRPEQSFKNAKGETVKEAAIPAFKPDVLMSAALDWAEYGHLSRGTEKRLSSEGYNVPKLGIPRSTKVGEAVRKTGKQIQQALPSL